MARPTKTGLEYFSLDTKMSDEVQLIKAKYGMEGYGMLIEMFQTIYDYGYYYPWTEREQLLFNMRVSDVRNPPTSIMEEAIKWGIFNEKMFSNYNILTSKRIQRTYIAAVYKRVGIQMVEEYLLVDIGDKSYIEIISINDINKEVTSIVSDIGNSATSIISDGKSTQSKVKEIKVKETKEKDSIPYVEIISYLNEKANKSFKANSKANKDLISGRWNEGYRLDDFKYVIDVKCQEWLSDSHWDKFLRPDTLFRPTNFEGYRNQKMKGESTKEKTKYDTLW